MENVSCSVKISHLGIRVILNARKMVRFDISATSSYQIIVSVLQLKALQNDGITHSEILISSLIMTQIKLTWSLMTKIVPASIFYGSKCMNGSAEPEFNEAASTIIMVQNVSLMQKDKHFIIFNLMLLIYSCRLYYKISSHKPYHLADWEVSDSQNF